MHRVGARRILWIFQSFEVWTTFKVFFHRFEGSYIELCTCKAKAFESLNESICMGSSSRNTGPAGHTYVSYAVDPEVPNPPPEWLSIIENSTIITQILALASMKWCVVDMPTLPSIFAYRSIVCIDIKSSI